MAAGGQMEVDTVFRVYKQTHKDLVSRFDPALLPEDVLKNAGFPEDRLVAGPNLRFTSVS